MENSEKGFAELAPTLADLKAIIDFCTDAIAAHKGQEEKLHSLINDYKKVRANAMEEFENRMSKLHDF